MLLDFEAAVAAEMERQKRFLEEGLRFVCVDPARLAILAQPPLFAAESFKDFQTLRLMMKRHTDQMLSHPRPLEMLVRTPPTLPRLALGHARKPLYFQVDISKLNLCGLGRRLGLHLTRRRTVTWTLCRSKWSRRKLVRRLIASVSVHMNGK